MGSLGEFGAPRATGMFTQAEMQEALREGLWGALQVKATSRTGRSLCDIQRMRSQREQLLESQANSPGSFALLYSGQTSWWGSLTRKRKDLWSFLRPRYRLFLHTTYTGYKATGSELSKLGLTHFSTGRQEGLSTPFHSFLSCLSLERQQANLEHHGTVLHSNVLALPTSSCQVGVGLFPHFLKNYDCN